ncbi:MAG TPA: hypothetical protein VFS36_06185 [Chitinophagaceae bacterium]|nr:hypothetical protein [Chitinophagaceae bacterium]
MNSASSASEYRIVGPFCSFTGVSRTDLVNSGSYLTAFEVVVFGITTFTGLGGSFFTIGFTGGFIDTSDLGSVPAGFFGAGFTGWLLGAGLLTTAFLGAGFGSGFFGAVFLATAAFTAFLAAGLAAFLGAVLFGAGLAGFLAADLTVADFFAGFVAPLPERTGFLAAAFFLVAILLPFF